MRTRLRWLLFALVSALALAVSPAGLGAGSTDQVVTPYRSGNCFLVETLDGTVKGCTPFPAGVVAQNFGYAAAADGSIVFTADDNTDPNSGGQGSIWLVRPNGPYTLGAAVHLDASTWDYDATISYDGSKVVFARYDPTTGSSDIYSVNSDGSGLRLVLSSGGAIDMTLPSISPDGSVIAYWCRPNRVVADPGCPIGTSYRHSGLMRVNSDGSNPRMILIGPGDAIDASGPTGLSWSPDGQWLTLDGLVNVDLGGGTYTTQRQAFRYRSDGSDLFDNRDATRQITHETGQQAARQTGFFPQFTPDGSGILYHEDYDDLGNAGNFAYAINVDGTNRHQASISYPPAPRRVHPDRNPRGAAAVGGRDADHRPLGSESRSRRCDEHARGRAPDGRDGESGVLEDGPGEPRHVPRPECRHGRAAHGCPRPAGESRHK